MTTKQELKAEIKNAETMILRLEGVTDNDNIPADELEKAIENLTAWVDYKFNLQKRLDEMPTDDIESDVKIEKDVPIQFDKSAPIPITKSKKYAHLKNMEIGESFAINKDDKKEIWLIYNVLNQHKRKTQGFQFISRTQPDGTLRFWRTA